MAYLFELEKYSGTASRYECPNCHKPHKFTRYVDPQTNKQIDDSVGKCDRIDQCGYHRTPKQHFEENKAAGITTNRNYAAKRTLNLNREMKQAQKPEFNVGQSIFWDSLCAPDYDGNKFVNYLAKICGLETATSLIEKYYIGNSKKWTGSTIFWQVDIHGKIRTGKIMLYNPYTGKRIREPYSHIAWVHNGLKKEDEELKQCFFGEHLLRDNKKQVGIVEAEKTAIVASAYKPDIIWLAAGSKEGLTEDKCSVLQGRKVELYPDLKAYSDWLDRATELSHITTFTVSGYLEQIATEEERQQGLDLADYLTRTPLIDIVYNNLLKSLADEFVAFCRLFAAGKKTAPEYKAYNKEICRKVNEKNITVEDFVKATIER
ncbi:MAG: DUF6371 domain-containing protein [Taibaiella sp.]|nr:DUF6371 domain-containing protein [Taibaiella sp.]